MNSLQTQSLSALPIRYLLVIWLFVLSAVAYLDRTNISIAGIQIGKEFAIDNTHLGWIFSAFLIGYAAFQIPAGLLVHKFGTRLVLTFAVLWWGLFTVLTAVVPPRLSGSVMILVLVRFALGAGESTMYPATSQFVERWFPMRERGKANGIIFGGVGVGSGLTPPLVTAIVVHYGWRASFWFSAVVGVVAGTVWYLMARDTPEEHRLVRDSELDRILKDREPTPATTPSTGRLPTVKRAVPWARIFNSKETLALTLSYFCFGYVAWVFFGWFYIYLAQARGLNLKTSALYSMLPFVGMTIGCLSGGVASDWIAHRFSLRLGRCLLPASSMALTALLLILGSRAEQPQTAGVVLALGAGILYVSTGSFWAVSANFAGEYAGLISGIMNMGAQIGGACTASLTPLIAAHFGWRMSFFAAAFLALLGALAWLIVDPKRSLLTQQSLTPSIQTSINWSTSRTPAKDHVNQIDLNNRHAVITGGAQGLGFSIAARLLSSGASVSLWDRDTDVLKLAFDQLQGQGVVSIETVDVSQADSVLAATENTIRKHSKIDILVASAGIAGPNFKSWEYPLDAWKQVIDINLTGVFLCCRAIIPHMLRQNYGRIVNISSIAGKEGNPTASGYSAAKAGVIAFTKSLGKETALNNIAVNCITPAAAKTRIFDQVTQEHIDFMLSKIPRGRFLKVDEVSSMVAWLVSEENSFTTAAVFDLSGGRATY